jgi:hypothetical protein
MSHSHDRDDEFIAFVDDATQELENHEHPVRGDSEEEARLNAQADFPSGVIRAVVRCTELAVADEMRRHTEKRRAEERETLKSIWPADLTKQLCKFPSEE